MPHAPPSVQAAVAYDMALSLIAKLSWGISLGTDLEWVRARLGEAQTESNSPNDNALLRALCHFIDNELLTTSTKE